jgi:hypothetical protein
MAKKIVKKTASEAGAVVPMEISGAVLSVAQVAQNIALVHQLFKDKMKDGVHYGIIEGTQKPSLWQPGAELLAFAFRLRPEAAPGKPVVEVEIRPDGHLVAVATVMVTHIQTGEVWGTGTALCSTMETKYAFRNSNLPIPPAYWELSKTDKAAALKLLPPDSKVKKVNQKWVAQQRSPNPNLADSFNTCIVMAKKRAFVQAVRGATAASDIFTIDVEDFKDVITTREPQLTVQKIVGVDPLPPLDPKQSATPAPPAPDAPPPPATSPPPAPPATPPDPPQKNPFTADPADLATRAQLEQLGAPNDLYTRNPATIFPVFQTSTKMTTDQRQALVYLITIQHPGKRESFDRTARNVLANLQLVNDKLAGFTGDAKKRGGVAIRTIREAIDKVDPEARATAEAALKEVVDTLGNILYLESDPATRDLDPQVAALDKKVHVQVADAMNRKKGGYSILDLTAWGDALATQFKALRSDQPPSPTDPPPTVLTYAPGASTTTSPAKKVAEEGVIQSPLMDFADFND